MAVKLADLPEALYQQAWQQFHKAWKADKLHHAWLITGVKGIGKTDFAYHMASALLGKNQDVEQLRDVKRIEFHPNLHTIDLTSDVDEDTKELISVDNIRDLQSHMRMTSPDGQYKVTLISPADYMNRNAANALLKTLEEPQGKSILILVCHSLGKLPETIRSRCMRLSIPSLTAAQLLGCLQQAYPSSPAAELQRIIQLSHGQLGLAKELMENQGLELYHSILSIMQAWPNFKAHELLEFSEKYGQKKEAHKADYIRDILLTVLTRAVKFLSGALAEDNVTQEEKLLFAKIKSQPNELLKVMDQIQEFDWKAKTFHLDQQLVLLRYFQYLKK